MINEDNIKAALAARTGSELIHYVRQTPAIIRPDHELYDNIAGNLTNARNVFVNAILQAEMDLTDAEKAAEASGSRMEDEWSGDESDRPDVKLRMANERLEEFDRAYGSRDAATDFDNLLDWDLAHGALMEYQTNPLSDDKVRKYAWECVQLNKVLPDLSIINAYWQIVQHDELVIEERWWRFDDPHQTKYAPQMFTRDINGQPYMFLQTNMG